MKVSCLKVHRSCTRLNDRRAFGPDSYEMVCRPVLHFEVVIFITQTIFLYKFGELCASYVERCHKNNSVFYSGIGHRTRN
jgi:hypothetical protein